VTYLVLEYSHDIFLVLEIILVALETQCSFTLVSSLCLIGDIEISGVDSGKEEDAHFPGAEPVVEDDIKIPGVDVEGPEASAPQSVEINGPGIHQDNPAPIQVARTQEVPAPQASSPVVEPSQATGLRRSTRVRFQTKHAYTLIMTGSKYSYAVT
jgi:hypothetical protein